MALDMSDTRRVDEQTRNKKLAAVWCCWPSPFRWERASLPLVGCALSFLRVGSPPCFPLSVSCSVIRVCVPPLRVGVLFRWVRVQRLWVAVLGAPPVGGRAKPTHLNHFFKRKKNSQRASKPRERERAACGRQRADEHPDAPDSPTEQKTTAPTQQHPAPTRAIPHPGSQIAFWQISCQARRGLALRKLTWSWAPHRQTWQSEAGSAPGMR